MCNEKKSQDNPLAIPSSNFLDSYAKVCAKAKPMLPLDHHRDFKPYQDKWHRNPCSFGPDMVDISDRFDH